LVVPPEASTLQARHVLVAWKDTREARRAVLDALPLLRAATDVTVVEIVPHSKEKDAMRSGADVAAWLSRHDVCATSHEVVSDFDSYGAFEGLLSQNAADLIVAGAYGHSRLQEWIFGGVTRDLLMKARCCCLLAN
jgi:nucleotide-binding universal stress UspA family protein